MEERYQEREEAQQLADMQELQSQLPDVELPEDAETEEPLFPDQQAMTNELPAQEDSEISEPIQVVNFHITDDALGRGTAKEKFRANIMAIQLLKKCESENRHATAEEQEILSRYVGWGGLADAFDESKPAWETEYLELKTVLTPEESPVCYIQMPISRSKALRRRIIPMISLTWQSEMCHSVHIRSMTVSMTATIL